MKKLLLTLFVFLTTTIAFAQSNYQDVVYLKNGSIIRGTIIEQVPNESLKIETADGNLFVYKMSEIEKMTKERVAAPSQSTAPSRSVPQTPQSAPQVQSAPQQSTTALQVIQEEKKVQWGAKGGINIASESTDNGETASRIGIHLGFFLETPISKRVGFQPELVYSMQGSTTKSGSTTGEDKFDYINLPLIFKIYVWQQRLSIDIGPQFGYMINAKLVKNGKTVDVYKATDLNKLDASIGLGMSYKLNDKFDLAWRVNVGMTKIVEDLSYTNSVVQLAAGYRF